MAPPLTVDREARTRKFLGHSSKVLKRHVDSHISNYGIWNANHHSASCFGPISLVFGGPISCDPGSMDPPTDAVGAVVADWKSNDKLILVAAGGIMAKVGNHSDLDRDELDSNKDVLAPIVRHLGFLASIHFAQVSVMSWMFVVPGVTFHLIVYLVGVLSRHMTAQA